MTGTRYIFVGLALLLLAGCAQNPVTGKADFVMMSESDEIALGRQYDEQVIKKQYKAYESKALQAYVDRIGQKLASQSHRPHLQYHFSVLDTPEVNAFALPGGYVYITRGIMAYLNSEAELAAVVGHEIGHVTARHSVRQQSAAQAASIGLNIASIFVPEIKSSFGQKLSNILGGALLSGYGREHELEADRLAAQYLARADYDPQAIIKVLRTLKNQDLMDAELAAQEGREPRRYSGLFATHPDNDTRLHEVVGEADKLKSATPFEGRDTFLAATDGLVFNENTDQGVLRNNRFYHPDLGFAMQFPEAWQVHNLPEALIAISPRGEARMQMQTDQKPEGSPLEYTRRLVGSGTQAKPFRVNGLPGALTNLPDGIVAVVYLDRHAFIFQGVGKTRQQLDTHRGAIINTVRSFQALTAEERNRVKPLRIRIGTARQGESYARLAKDSPLGNSAESYLRLINAQYPGGEPQAGQRIKIVE